MTMTYNNVLNGTFTGVIISELTAKDGKHIGFISPNAVSLCAAITAWKVNAGRQRCDGNIQFVFPVQGEERDYTAGNAEDLKKNMSVSFKVRCDSNGMPQAYEVKPVETEIIPSVAKFKPLEAKPQMVEKLSEAASLAYSELDEDEEEEDPSVYETLTEEELLAYDDYDE